MAEDTDYMWKCKEAGEIAVMEVGRDRAPKARDVTGSAESFKRRKLEPDTDDDDNWLFRDRCNVYSPRNSVSQATPESSDSSDLVPASGCSSNGELRSVDLQVESNAQGFEPKISVFMFSGERNSSSQLCAVDTDDELESSTAAKPSAAASLRGTKNPASKMPPPAEIEEFFSAAEKYQQKLFANKYNYDVVKDAPLEGRYQWIRLKP